MRKQSSDIVELEDGFYHKTEYEDLVGPFDSAILAQKALDAYVKWLHHDIQKYGIRKMKDNYE